MFPAQLSVAVGATTIVAEHWPVTMGKAVSSGTGATQSLTVTVNVQLAAVLFAESVALHVTVVVPTGKNDAEGGLQAIVRPAQSPLVVGPG